MKNNLKKKKNSKTWIQGKQNLISNLFFLLLLLLLFWAICFNVAQP